jgi:hypothetical protein
MDIFYPPVFQSPKLLTFLGIQPRRLDAYYVKVSSILEEELTGPLKYLVNRFLKCFRVAELNAKGAVKKGATIS